MRGESFEPKFFFILVVDDIATNLRLLRAMLEPIGYNLTFCRGGKQALERIYASKPDLILLDLIMPEINGLEVCKILKADPNYADIPIIFLTGSHEQKHLIKALELGAADYINKPCNKRELLGRIRNHLFLKYTIDQLRSTQIKLEKALKEVEILANTDSLTGVFNRRRLFEIALQEFNRVDRYGAPFSILLIDLDHFKKVNDHYGHQVGDTALCKVVQNINNIIRNVDSLGRYGGEEFMAILPETNGEQALVLADRIRTMVANNIIETKQGNLSLTLSIGVTSYHPDDTSIDDMISRADQAVYQAKELGRNRCCLL
ncbi:MAG: diguanylate cyclase [Microcoleaceae cyanobacterium MO_207.B10]|nr:diguanylate cyclase [Microcoleaceae cyanobacterium MO_207.B10]